MRTWNDTVDVIEAYENNHISEEYCIQKLKEYTDRNYPYSGAAIAYVLSGNNDYIKSFLDLEL